MQWEKTPSLSANEVYHLNDASRELLTLVFHPFSNSVRVESDGEKRVLLIRQEGFRKHKTVVRNEYGQKVCELGTEDGNRFIEMEEEKYYYKLDASAGPEVKLYRDLEKAPVMVCTMPGAEMNPALLIGLGWYMTRHAAEMA
ncbi:MAG: hypothetical protein IPP93_14300 [Chitinophagaceae bacterium]|nr:hypothetical protein [Chitinophagaceae bacterium]